MKELHVTKNNGVNEILRIMKWVSVEDRFPEQGTWVIGATHINTPGKFRISTELFYDGEHENEHYWLKEGDWGNRVTHWMPLPALPEG